MDLWCDTTADSISRYSYIQTGIIVIIIDNYIYIYNIIIQFMINYIQYNITLVCAQIHANYRLMLHFRYAASDVKFLLQGYTLDLRLINNMISGK